MKFRQVSKIPRERKCALVLVKSGSVRSKDAGKVQKLHHQMHNTLALLRNRVLLRKQNASFENGIASLENASAKSTYTAWFEK